VYEAGEKKILQIAFSSIFIEEKFVLIYLYKQEILGRPDLLFFFDTT
jgi:hypothetical protein